jgi:eukaryotic-like serine/threonine-protein kinase
LPARRSGIDVSRRPAHTGTYRDDGPRQFHRVKWKFQTGDRIVSSPETGTTRWKLSTGGERRFEPKGLHGLQPKNQTIADPFDVYLSSAVVAAGTAFFGSGDGNVYALDALSGNLKWMFRTGNVVHASPAYADGVVFFGSWDSYLYAVDASTGQEKWRFQGGEDPVIHNQVGFQSSPAVVNGVVYTDCRDSNLYAIDAATGREKWRFNNGGSWVITSPAVRSCRIRCRCLLHTGSG